MPKSRKKHPHTRKQKSNAKSSTSVEIELDIDNLTHDGRGIGRLDGKTVFTQGALPGEHVKARITRQKSRYDEAILAKIIHPSEKRTNPKCEYFNECGGCSLQHLEVESQIHYKTQHFLDCFRRLAGLEIDDLLPTIDGPHWNYRRKARLVCFYDKRSKQVALGFRKKNSKDIVDIEHCPVLTNPFDMLIKPIKDVLNALETSNAITHIEIIAADQQNAVVLRQVKSITQNDLELLSDFSKASNVQIYIDKGNDAIQYEQINNQNLPLYYSLGPSNIRLEFTPANFIQVNKFVNQKTIEQVLNLMELKPSDNVLDLFCGIGNFSLPVSRCVNSIVGVEANKSSIEQAKHNAAINECDNAKFYYADLNEDVHQLAWFKQNSFNKIILDPPRAGALNLMPAIAVKKCELICYISCDPATLARDAAELMTREKYRIKTAGIMNMFPHTSHVESMVLFEKFK